MIDERAGEGAAAGVSPPEIAIGVGRLAGGDRSGDAAVGIHRDDFDRVEAVGRETELAAQEAERATGDVPAGPIPGYSPSGTTTPQFSNSVRNASPTVAPPSTAIARRSVS